MKLSGVVTINYLLKLLKILITKNSLAKIEFDCNDLMKVNYELIPNNKYGAKLGILIHPF